MPKNKRTDVPIWYWAVAVLLTLWNSYAGYDYINSILLNEAYLEGYGRAMIEYIGEMPIWTKTFWGLSVLSSILGCVGLLKRKAYAFALFLIAFAFLLIAWVFEFITGDLPADESSYTTSWLVFIVAVLSIWISKKAKSKVWLS